MVNLLPQQLKNARKVRSIAYSVILVYVVIIIGLGLGAAAMATFNLTGQLTINDKTNRINALRSEAERKRELAAKAAFVEDRLQAEAQLKSPFDWDAILEAMASNTPVDVRLTVVNLNDSQGQAKLVLAGETSNRRSVILLRDKLESDNNFVSAVITNISDNSSEGGKKFNFNLEANVKPTS